MLCYTRKISSSILYYIIIHVKGNIAAKAMAYKYVIVNKYDISMIEDPTKLPFELDLQPLLIHIVINITTNMC